MQRQKCTDQSVFVPPTSIPITQEDSLGGIITSISAVEIDISGGEGENIETHRQALESGEEVFVRDSGETRRQTLICEHRNGREQVERTL